MVTTREKELLGLSKRIIEHFSGTSLALAKEVLEFERQFEEEERNAGQAKPAPENTAGRILPTASQPPAETTAPVLKEPVVTTDRPVTPAQPVSINSADDLPF